MINMRNKAAGWCALVAVLGGLAVLGGHLIRRHCATRELEAELRGFEAGCATRAEKSTV